MGGSGGGGGGVTGMRLQMGGRGLGGVKERESGVRGGLEGRRGLRHTVFLFLYKSNTNNLEYFLYIVQ